MALGKSIKMYLTIFVATTCMYMILYQYHISRQPMPQPDIIKLKDKSIGGDGFHGNDGSYSSSSSLYSTDSIMSSTKDKKSSTHSTSLTTSLSLFSLPSRTTKLFKKMNLFLWSPMSFLSSPSSSSSSSSAKNIKKTSSESMVIPSSAAALKAMTKKMQSFSTSKASSYALASAKYRAKVQKPSSSSSAAALLTATVVDLNNTFLNTSSPSPAISSSTTTTTTVTAIPSDGSATSSSKVNRPQQHYKNEISNNNRSNKKHPSISSSSPLRENIDTPPLYIITPTYRRPEQLAELTRLGYTLKHVVNLLWLVIEDANKTSDLVIETLNRIGVPYEYFLAPMPDEYKKTKKAKPRGVSNRNRGLKWLRENATEGVFYFADDDNTYDISIFEQMRYTKKVSMWPVGLVTKYGVSSPIIKQGKIVGFYDGWIGGRKYPVDMAGFAVSVKFLHERPQAKMPFKPGYEEDGFLKSLGPLDNADIELLANNCTEILTWHTQTKKNNPAEKVNATKYSDTNLMLIDKALVRP
ncbi:glucuronyltransferase P isoform X1 [Haematobia irritans]|uniref:glucuronyltransferase P isoform X1 n=1 Tax=Haematobia irritans TaxID=7368 RepID=UPI003F4F7159